MARYIDADALLAKLNEEKIPYDSDINYFICHAPTADVAEMVRCEDCKFRKIEFGWNGERYKMCANTDYPTDDDAYCSYGERREDEIQGKK